MSSGVRLLASRIRADKKDSPPSFGPGTNFESMHKGIRPLCRATDPKSCDIAGALILVQLWAWSRFPYISPAIKSIQQINNAVDDVDADADQPLPEGPYGTRWRNAKDVKDVPPMCLSSIDQSLLGNVLIKAEGMAFSDASDVFPDRRVAHENWRHRWRNYITIWYHRCEHVVTSDKMIGLMGYHDPYMVWYRQITRRFINRRSGCYEMMTLCNMRICQMFNPAQELDPKKFMDLAAEAYQLAFNTLEVSNELHWLDSMERNNTDSDTSTHTSVPPTAPPRRRIKKKETEGQEDQQTKTRVVKVDSLESWDLFVNRATNQGCPGLFPKVQLFYTKRVPGKCMHAVHMLFLVLLQLRGCLVEGAPIDKLVGANPEEIRKRIDSFVQSIRVYVA
uniref:Aminotransferase-like plant mobile domain-containing protein n=1 Tax=Fagus sylvatica TaxID=28930 RepID=A0A2N9HQT4_FAGSY